MWLELSAQVADYSTLTTVCCYMNYLSYAHLMERVDRQLTSSFPSSLEKTMIYLRSLVASYAAYTHAILFQKSVLIRRAKHHESQECIVSKKKKIF
jgi:hypothetical protein